MFKWSKVLILALALATLTSTAWAQPRVVPFHIGGHLGLNLAKVSVEDLSNSIDNKMRMGFSFGGMIQYDVVPVFAIETGFLYDMRGTKLENVPFNVNNNIVLGDITYKLSYLAIPILGKVKIGAAPLKPFIHAGPEIDILLSAKEKDEVADFDEEEDIKDDTKGTDFALVFGGGIEFPLGTVLGTAQVDYKLGLSDINDFEGDEVPALKNRVIALSVGVLY